MKNFTNFIKREWMAVLACFFFGSAITCATLTVINNWDFIKTTLIR